MLGSDRSKVLIKRFFKNEGRSNCSGAALNSSSSTALLGSKSFQPFNRFRSVQIVPIPSKTSSQNLLSCFSEVDITATCRLYLATWNRTGCVALHHLDVAQAT